MNILPSYGGICPPIQLKGIILCSVLFKFFTHIHLLYILYILMHIFKFMLLDPTLSTQLKYLSIGFNMLNPGGLSRECVLRIPAAS